MAKYLASIIDAEVLEVALYNPIVKGYLLLLKDEKLSKDEALSKIIVELAKHNHALQCQLTSA